MSNISTYNPHLPTLLASSPAVFPSHIASKLEGPKARKNRGKLTWILIVLILPSASKQIYPDTDQCSHSVKVLEENWFSMWNSGAAGREWTQGPSWAEWSPNAPCSGSRGVICFLVSISMLSKAESKPWWDICQVNGWVNGVLSSNSYGVAGSDFSFLVRKNWTRNPLGPFPALQFDLPSSSSCTAAPKPAPALIHSLPSSLQLLHSGC